MEFPLNYLLFNRPPVEEMTTVIADSTTAYNGDLEYFVAVYSYHSTEPGDLVFSEGDSIIVTSKNGDWWTGTLGDNSGIFPSNYVQKIENNGATVTNNVSF